MDDYDNEEAMRELQRRARSRVARKFDRITDDVADAVKKVFETRTASEYDAYMGEIGGRLVAAATLNPDADRERFEERYRHLVRLEFVKMLDEIDLAIRKELAPQDIPEVRRLS